MKTSWNKTIEGRQYRVQVKGNSLRLEMVSELICELVGGGYCIDLPEQLEDDVKALDELKSVFSTEELLEIIAFSRALRRMSRRDLEERNEKFNTIYYSEIQKAFPRLE